VHGAGTLRTMVKGDIAFGTSAILGGFILVRSVPAPCTAAASSISVEMRSKRRAGKNVDQGKA